MPDSSEMGHPGSLIGSLVLNMRQTHVGNTSDACFASQNYPQNVWDGHVWEHMLRRHIPDVCRTCAGQMRAPVFCTYLGRSKTHVGIFDVCARARERPEQIIALLWSPL